MDNVMAHDSYAKYGLYFSRDGWKVKYIFTEWLNKYIPLWLSKLIAQDFLVIFLDLFHTAKTLMIACFVVAIFGITWYSLLVWFCWGIVFNVCYYVSK
jgi:hypothetical protein